MHDPHDALTWRCLVGNAGICEHAREVWPRNGRRHRSRSQRMSTSSVAAGWKGCRAKPNTCAEPVGQTRNVDFNTNSIVTSNSATLNGFTRCGREELLAHQRQRPGVQTSWPWAHHVVQRTRRRCRHGHRPIPQAPVARRKDTGGSRQARAVSRKISKIFRELRSVEHTLYAIVTGNYRRMAKIWSRLSRTI